MARRWLAWVGLAGAVLAMTAAGIPTWRFEREKAAARSEGIAVDASDVPREPVSASENAAPGIERAVDAWREDGTSASLHTPCHDAAHRLIMGYAQAKDRGLVSAWVLAHGPNLELWRTASARLRVDFGERTGARWEATSPDVIDERYGARNLIAAAAVDVEPKTNLLAAARLSNLLRREGNLYSVGKGARLGRECLLVARRKGLTKEVLAVLDPPSDLRRALLPELPRLLKRIEAGNAEPGMRLSGVQGWLMSLQFAMGHPERKAVAQWRRFWSALPKDPTYYEGAARVVDRELPEILLFAHPIMRVAGPPVSPGFSPHWMFTSTTGISGNLREIGLFEELRHKPL